MSGKTNALFFDTDHERRHAALLPIFPSPTPPPQHRTRQRPHSPCKRLAHQQAHQQAHPNDDVHLRGQTTGVADHAPHFPRPHRPTASLLHQHEPSRARRLHGQVSGVTTKRSYSSSSARGSKVSNVCSGVRSGRFHSVRKGWSSAEASERWHNAVRKVTD